MACLDSSNSSQELSAVIKVDVMAETAELREKQLLLKKAASSIQNYYMIDNQFGRIASPLYIWTIKFSSQLSSSDMYLDEKRSPDSNLSDRIKKEIEIDLKTAENAFILEITRHKNRRIQSDLVYLLIITAINISLIALTNLILRLDISQWAGYLPSTDVVRASNDMLWVFLGSFGGVGLLKILDYVGDMKISDAPDVIRKTLSPLIATFSAPALLSLALAGLIALGALNIELFDINFRDFWQKHDHRSAVILGLFAAVAGEKAASQIKDLIKKLSGS